MKYLFALFTCILLTGCELLPAKSDEIPFDYANYYLSLTKMPPQALKNESAAIKAKASQSNQSAIKLALLYAYPKSPIHNAYNAKSLLNNLKNKPHQTTANQGFIVLLNDLLNQQLYIYQHFDDKQQQQHQVISSLTNENGQLKAKIKQLKRIETTLNTRG